ncbi:hypothetical protein [Rhizobium leguminosarum]|uniref:hypothetical protein n=1 Tax=Rhizobium leguminosarum TaxID=384 RepID=UPI001031637C|nr:hypothetical protein [Rhizobium leguminosarum]TAU83274.1 hypothetical protein ELI40_08290 [Rhizobium leguminosarum]
MKALARLWTWIGNLFVPLAIGWAVYLRNGLADKPPPDGVLVSRAYWGVLIALVAAAAMAWTVALYVHLAKTEDEPILVPPNTTFEDDESRNRIISWGTVAVFVLAVVASLAVFGARYSESRIHGWNDQQPLQPNFLGSRARAFEQGCDAQPCFAVAQRVDADDNPIFGVNEYILYLTDGVLLFFALLAASGLVFLMWQILLRRRPRPFEL